MDSFTATMIAEGCPETAGLDPQDVTFEDVVDAWQHLIDTGLALIYVVSLFTKAPSREMQAFVDEIRKPRGRTVLQDK